ncbi:MAG TPA: DinB family protein [Bryobacteraceae bacterium]|nr:DinB family protein [Bryobacteraceae bacterium]
MNEPPPPEAWMRGPIPDLNPVVSHLLRATEQIREDAESLLQGLTPAEIWSSLHGVTSVGFHAKHLAGSTTRLLTYLAGRQLSEEQLAAIPREHAGQESAEELLALISSAFDLYEEAICNLSPDVFGAPREIGRRRYPAAAISIAIHIVEHAQRHVGGMIAAAKLARGANRS